MLERMKQGIGVVRIVAIDPEEAPDTYAWLQKFRAQRRYYTEYDYQGKPLPIDLMIFDDKKVIVYLSTNARSKEFDRAIKFDNPRVALVFRAMFERLIQDSVLATRTVESNKAIQPLSSDESINDSG